MKIEYPQLLQMGATERQLEAYSNTDPLTIQQDGDEMYSMDGAIVASGMTAEQVLDALEGLRASWDEE
jgi:hypothetical protein